LANAALDALATSRLYGAVILGSQGAGAGGVVSGFCGLPGAAIAANWVEGLDWMGGVSYDMPVPLLTLREAMPSIHRAAALSGLPTGAVVGLVGGALVDGGLGAIPGLMIGCAIGPALTTATNAIGVPILADSFTHVLSSYTDGLHKGVATLFPPMARANVLGGAIVGSAVGAIAGAVWWPAICEAVAEADEQENLAP
jgi:hypothetical protein